jgi:hypothetical protein
MFKRGLPLQLAIIVVCQMAFILFGATLLQKCSSDNRAKALYRL